MLRHAALADHGGAGAWRPGDLGAAAMKVDADIRALEDDQLEAWISIARLSLAMGVPEMAGDARRALERRLAMMEAEGAERVERARAWEARARARADQGMWA